LSGDLWVRRSRIHTIANGVRLAPLKPSSVREELGLEPADRLAVAVGSLYPVKGHRYLLEAFGLLAKRFPRLHIAIAGRGDKGALLAQADTLGLRARFHLLGHRDDIASLLAAADVFALPSLDEGLPLALLEAMTVGRPIVATDVGDVSAALADGAAGALVNPADASALAAAMARLLTDPSEASRLAQAAAQRAAAEYALSTMVERYVSLYSELIPSARVLEA
jgi:glycosyltransferase involved in cell wall biosynthesis